MRYTHMKASERKSVVTYQCVRQWREETRHVCQEGGIIVLVDEQAMREVWSSERGGGR